jgi:small GTP-binding protein
MATEKYYHYQFKLIVIGSSGVGKSCILGRIDNPDYFKPDRAPTTGVDFKIKTIQVEGKTIKSQIWDTAGQERFHAITKGYYRDAVGGFIVFDVKERKSFGEVKNWVEKAKEGAYPREHTFVLVGNKIDEDVKRPRVVDQQEAKEVAQRFGMEYIETSAKTGQNIDELLPFLVSKVYWKLRVGVIVLEDGWHGVTEGDLCTQTPNRKPEFTMSEKRRSCCK